MTCFANTFNSMYDSGSAEWSDLISVSNVYVPGGGTQTAAVLLSGMNALSTSNAQAEFQILVNGNVENSFQALFPLTTTRIPMSLSGCASIQGSQPSQVTIQVRKEGGDGNVCIQGPITIVVIS